MGICSSTPIEQATSEPDAVAVELMQAFRGLGSDKAAIIESLGRRTSRVLQDVPAAYSERYPGQDLIADLKSETKMADTFINLSADFTHTMVSLFLPPGLLEARSMRAAMFKVVGTDEMRLEEVLFFRSREQIDIIKAAYQEEYKSDLAEDIKSETSALVRRLYLAAVNSKDETNSAQADANALYAAGQGKLGTDETTFAEILGKAGPEHIMLIKNLYWESYNRELYDMVENEFACVFTEGPIKKALLRILGGDRKVNAHAKFLARRFTKAARHKQLVTLGTGLGTDERMLSRLIITNRESGILGDPRNHLSAYTPVLGACDEHLKALVPPNHPAETLTGLIRDETSGHYMRLLLTMVDKFSQPVDWNRKPNV